MLGIHTTDETQFIFVDTPGYQTKHLNMMNRGLNQSVVNALKEVDVVLHLTTPSFIDEIDEKIMQMIPRETPAILAMNKIDLIKDKNKLLSFIDDYQKRGRFEAILPISIKKKFNLNETMAVIAQFLPEHDFVYEADELTDKN